MSVVIIINPPPTKPPGNENFTAKDDGAIIDGDGNTVAKFNSVADAIAYLNHLVVDPAKLAEATDERA